MPKDIPGECNARIYVWEDYNGDSYSGVRCSLKEGHEGFHKASYNDEYRAGDIIIQWEKDSREWCEVCGLGFPSLSWDTTCWTCKKNIMDKICKECDSPDCSAMIDDDTCPIEIEDEKRCKENYEKKFREKK